MANVTVTKKADATGCPIISTGAPGIPVTVLEPTSGNTITCWLRPSSSLFAAVNAGGPVVFDEVTLTARRNADEFAGGHVRTTAEQADAVTAAAASAAEAVKVATANTSLDAYLTVVRALAPGARTPEQRAVNALVKLLLGKE